MKRILIWLVIMSVLAFVAYNFLFRPREVVAYQSTVGPIVFEALGTGSIESRTTVELGFELTGRIVAIDVDQGDQVTRGQELARIDPLTYHAEVALAEQEVAHTESTVRRLQADIERAKAVLKGAEDNIARTKPQVESGVATAEALDVAEERVKVASAELLRAEAALLEGKQVILSAQRRLDRAKTDLTKTKAISPFDGIVIKRQQEVGDIASPGSTILRIAESGTIWASVWVDETYLNSLKVGLPARIALRSDPTNFLTGKVTRIGREVDRETRELLVDVTIAKAPKNLIFGQRVDLWIELAKKENVRRVAAGHLVYRDGKEGVYLDQDGRARFRPLTLGGRGRDLVEVLSGLSDDDTLIVPDGEGAKPLRERQKIEVTATNEAPTE